MTVFYFITGVHLPDGPFIHCRPVKDDALFKHWLSLGDVELTELRDGYLLYGMVFRKLVPYVRELLEAGDRVLAIPMAPPGPGHATFEDLA